MHKLILAVAMALVLAVSMASGQDTRGMIFGTVTDPQGAVVPGASVTVVNTETNVSLKLSTNDRGYYEANLLLAGAYTVQVEAAGFKTNLRRGIVLPVGSRIEVNALLEVGAQTETVSITAEAPLLETNSAASGRVLDNRSIMDLPLLGNSAILLVKLTPGMQTSGVNDYVALHSNLGGMNYNVTGNVGGGEWSIDGVSNNGNRRRPGYLPYTDTLQEFKVETANFDASVGHSTGVSVQMMSKSGSNEIHGALTEQHWQQRWNGTPFFVKQLYYSKIAAAVAAGDNALAEQLRHTQKQATGRSNNWAASIGGPIILPKIFNGKNRLFFFFSYNAFKDAKTEAPSGITMTVPTMANRQGDFSALLNLPNAAQYQLYDPLSVKVDPTKKANYVRTPISGNLMPKSYFMSPIYNAYVKLIPTPNNDPTSATQAPTNNYLATAMPYNWDYKAFTNRVDFQATSSHRLYGRWSWNDFLQNRSDWTYSTMPGLHSDGLNRHNVGANVDWVWTRSAATVFDFAVSGNEFRDGNSRPVATSLTPSDMGFPKYLDQFAGSRTMMPWLGFNAYRNFGDVDGSNDGYPTQSRYRTMNGKADVFHVRGNHSFRAGLDVRAQYLSGAGSPFTSGNFSFNNQWTRKYDTTLEPASNLGHEWAAFIMGMPNNAYVDRQDSYVMLTPYYGWYGMDTWRVNRKLTLTLGLRMEYELGSTERYNRAIGWFDPTLALPITAAAQAAYAAKPIPELAASSFAVAGGSVYPGVAGAGRKLNQNELMFLPRIGFAFQLRPTTVIRGGYGMYFDTWNVMNFNSVDQLGYSRQTIDTFSTDAGMTWLAGNPAGGVAPVSDPFPVRTDGTRFNEPVRSALGSTAKAGIAWNPYIPYDLQRARQQRWRVGVEHQFGKDDLVEVAYSGSYSDRNYLNLRLNYLPQQYWVAGTVRDTSAQTAMSANGTNPFLLANFASLAQSNAAVYQDISSKSFFTSSTIAKNGLLRPYPQMGGTGGNFSVQSNLGKVKTHDLEVRYEHRMSRGLLLTAGYSYLNAQAADYFLNEYEQTPGWRESSAGRPHRFMATGIYEFPFGKGRALLNHGVLSHIVGGFQTGVSYEWQPGALVSFGNVLYYGDPSNIVLRGSDRTLDRWFNTAGCVATSAAAGPGDIVVAAGQPCTQGFDKRSASALASYQIRTFPTYVDGVRADSTNLWNINAQRNFRIKERVTLQFRVDALNAMNRSQFNAPDANPTSTTFGKITTQSASMNRWLQFQVRIRY